MNLNWFVLIQNHVTLSIFLLSAIVLDIVQTQPLLAQGANAESIAAHLIIPSPNIADIELLTHTVDARLQLNQVDTAVANASQLRPEQLILTIQATYRFHNSGKDGRTVRLTVAPARPSVQENGGISVPQADVQVDGQSADLQVASDGTSTFQLALAPDQRRSVLLNYSIALGGMMLPAVVYPIDWINGWDNEMSLRVNIGTYGAIPRESWTTIAPDGWNYALSSDIQQPDIKWLYDAVTPESALQLQFVHPLFWRSLQENITASASNPGAASFLSVGNAYKQLFLAATSAITNRSAGISQASVNASAELFYAQAIAAYTEGIQTGNDANDAPSALAQLHTQLASLYRHKVVADDDGTQHARLTVREATTALNLLPAESTLRAELTQWQVEGLYSLLQDARRQQKWNESLGLIDRIIPLVEINPSPIINAQRLNEIRRIILTQEALDLLELGNKDAATLLAGPEIANADLQPPVGEQSLFRQWQIEVTVQVDRTFFNVRATTDGEQLQQAQNGLSGIIGAWQRSGWIQMEEAIEVAREQVSADELSNDTDSSVEAGAAPVETEQAYFIIAKFFVDHAQPRDALLPYMPDDANWAMLRLLISSLRPDVERVGTLLMEEKSIQMDLDLRSAGDHWDTMAAKLRRDSRSAESEATLAVDDPRFSPTLDVANAALMKRIRSANFANEAKVWHDLAQNSWVMVRLETSSSGSISNAETITSDVATAGTPVSRTWVATVETPPQRLQVEAASLASARIALLFVSIIVGLFGISGLLWWLL